MIGGLHASRMRASVPAIGPWVPTATLHLAFAALTSALCVLVLEPPFWLGFGVLLAVTATFLPSLVPKGWVILVLALSQFWREPLVTDVAFYMLLAGVHLLHVIGGLAQQMPWHGRVQIGALVRPFQRFLVVQAVVQGVAVAALVSFSGDPRTVPGLPIVSAAVLGVVAAILARGLRHARTGG